MTMFRAEYFGPATTAIAAVALLVLGAVVGGGLRSCTGPDLAPAGYTRVEVDSSAIVEGEPDPDVGVVESITRQRREPTVVATAPGAAREDVAAFCAAAGWERPGWSSDSPEKRTTLGENLNSGGDSIHRDGSYTGSGNLYSDPGASWRSRLLEEASPIPTPRDPEPLRANQVLFARSGIETRDQLQLRIVSSDGALIHGVYDGCRLPRTWRADGDDVLVQCNRFWWVPPAIGTAVGAGLLYLAATAEDPLLRSGAMLGGGIAVGWSVAGFW